MFNLNNNNNLNSTIVDLYTLYKLTTDETTIKAALSVIFLCLLTLIGYILYSRIGLILTIIIGISFLLIIAYLIYKIRKSIINSPLLNISLIKKDGKTNNRV